MIAHFQINLLNAMICGHVKRFILLAYFNNFNGFIGGDFENVQKLRPRLAVTHKLYDFVNASIVRADVEDLKLLNRNLVADSKCARENLINR